MKMKRTFISQPEGMASFCSLLCKKCAAADLRANNVPEDKIEEELDKMKHVCQGFGYRQYGKKRIEVIYKETPDGWLEIDTEKEFDPEEKAN